MTAIVNQRIQAAQAGYVSVVKAQERTQKASSLEQKFCTIWNRTTDQGRLEIQRAYHKLCQTELEEEDGGAYRVRRAVAYYFSPLRTAFLAVTLLATIGTIALAILLPADLRVLGVVGSLFTGAALTYSIVTPSSDFLTELKPSNFETYQSKWIECLSAQQSVSS
jgi:ABC-type siderophore export system fused ATPase/permease subunit